MGERKVLNKYFPPDFDPENIPKRKRPKDGQIKVRVMLPFTCQCQTCGEFIYRGRKFTSRQEFAPEKYLTIPIFRFYIKCPACCAEITFKTDPEHADYVCELGATRHFEPWRPDDARLELFKKPENKAEVGDSMLQLETRTKDSKREMDILDALEEIKEMNARHTKLSIEQVIAAKKRRVEEKVNEEDEEIIKKAFNNQQVVKRLEEDEEEDSEIQVKKETISVKKIKKEENSIKTEQDEESSPKKIDKEKSLEQDSDEQENPTQVKQESSSTTILQPKNPQPETNTIVKPQFNVIVKKKKKDKPKKDKSHKKEKKKKRKKQE